jgi:hypothetical protein
MFVIPAPEPNMEQGHPGLRAGAYQALAKNAQADDHQKISTQKKPATRAGFQILVRTGLLDLAFLVHDVFTHDRVVFFDFHFSGSIFLVFVGRIEMPCSCGGIQADLVSRAFSHDDLPLEYLNVFRPSSGLL